MKVIPFFASCILFVFVVALFPEIQTACATVSGTSMIAQLLGIFPVLFVAFAAIMPVYFGVVTDK